MTENSKRWQDNSDGWVVTMNKSKEMKEKYDTYMKEEIKYVDSLNGVLRIDVANAPSFWFIMNSVDKRKPDNDFLCPRALNALKCAHYHDTIIVLQTHNLLRPI